MSNLTLLSFSTTLLPSSPSSIPRQKSPSNHSTNLNPPQIIPISNYKYPPPALTTSRILKNYANLASKLASTGRLHEFLTIAETILSSAAIPAGEISRFIARIDRHAISGGISVLIGDGRFDDVLDFLCRADKMGIRALSLLDESAVEAVRVECGRVLEEGGLEEFVRLMGVLAGKIEKFFLLLDGAFDY